MSEDLGFGREPATTPFENGRVLPQEETVEFSNDDEHFAAVDKLVDSGVADYHDARNRLGYDAVEAARTLVDVKGETPARESGIAERLTTIEERFGFIPHTKDELSDTYDLTGKDLVGGAAKHLNTVFHRQKRYMEEPDRTVRSIVSRYADYAKNARVEHAFLKQTEELIDNGKGDLDPTRLGSDWRLSGSLARPVMHTLWMRDVSKFMRDDDDTDPLKAMKDGAYLTSDKQAVARAQAMLEGPKKSTFAEDLVHSISSEQGRYEFWVKTLQEARNHKLAAPIAYAALVELGIEKDDRR